MRIALITPLVEPSDPLLGFIHTWVVQLAQRVEHLHVLQLWKSTPPLPANVTLHSLDRNGLAGKPGALARLTRTLANLCWRRQVDGVIAHMGPIFAVCAAPVVKPARIPLSLWYAHGAVSPMLRLAHLLVDRVGTSTPDGFRIPSTKVTITGQGIDTDRFQPGENQDRNRIVSIGRISPVKHYEVLIDAMHLLRAHGRDAVRLEIIGGATLSSEVNYRDQLRSVVARLALDDTVTIRDGVPHHAVAHEYQQAAIFASCSQTGSLDKAVLEAASTGAIPITTNPALASFFGPEASEHMPEQTSAADLARSIDFWLSQSPQTRRDRASMLRERVIRAHSVGHLTDELVRLARPLPSR